MEVEWLKEDERLRRGTLSNGLRYAILPNTQPPNRVEVHLVVDAGSLDENETEQGLAHLVEHVLFCGTEQLPNSENVKVAMAALGMSFGADVNASTDFRSTTYTFYGPTKKPPKFPDFGSEVVDGLDGVLQILRQICFHARIEESMVKKEVAAVLSELQLRNTVDFRTQKAFYEKLHSETRLPLRYPIGLESVLRRCTAADVRAFYERYYVPNNVTLYVVGELAVDDAVASIERIFGDEREREVQQPHLSRTLDNEHSFGRRAPEQKFASFSHHQNTQVVVTFAVKVARSPLLTFDQIRVNFVDTILGSVFEERVEYLYQESDDPDFINFGWSHDDSYREGCGLNAMYVACEPNKFSAAVRVAVREATRLGRHGVTVGEYERAKVTLLQALREEAVQNETKQSSELISDLIDETELGDVFLSRAAEYELFSRAAQTVDADMVARRAMALFSGLGFGTTRKLQLKSQNEAVDGKGDAEPALGSSEDEHGDNVQWELVVGCGDPFISLSVPPKCKITSQTIQAILNEVSHEDVEAPSELDIPETLFQTPPQVADFVELPYAAKKGFDVTNPKRPVESTTGVWLRRLSNGVRGTFQVNQNEAGQFALRLIIPGGFVSTQNALDMAALSIGMSVMIGGGAAGHLPHVVSKYVAAHGIDIRARVGMENAVIDVSAGVNDDGLQRAFELVCAFLTSANWDAMAMDRARREQMILADDVLYNVEKRTAEAAAEGYYDDDERFKMLSRPTLQQLTLELARSTIGRFLDSESYDVLLVGDVDAAEVDELFLLYCGSLPRQKTKASVQLPPVRLRTQQPTRHVSVFDSEDRAVTFLLTPIASRYNVVRRRFDAKAGGMVPFTPEASNGSASAVDEERRRSPLFGMRCLVVLSEIINNRLFKEVREEKGLTYWVSFELGTSENLDFNSYVVRMAPLADRVEDAIEAVMETLSAVARGDVTDEEFRNAVAPLIAHCESSLKLNGYWLSLCANLHNEKSPKDTSCITGIGDAYASLTAEDVRTYACPHIQPRIANVVIGVTRPYRTLGDIFTSLTDTRLDIPFRAAAFTAAAATLAAVTTVATVVVRRSNSFWR